MASRKSFTDRQVFVLIFCIVAGISFIETSEAMWSLAFWKEFALNLILYGVIVEFIVILLSNFLNKEE